MSLNRFAAVRISLGGSPGARRGACNKNRKKRGRLEPQFFILTIAVAAASALQSATGIGFGVVAGPVLLIALNSGAAIQLSIALSFLICVLLVPSLWGHVDRRLLIRLLAGSAAGLPLGLAVFLSVDIDLLKLLAALAVLFTLVFVLRAGASAGVRGPHLTGWMEPFSMGVFSGVMSGSLAMPGPIPAAWMAGRSYDKQTLRATLLAMFLFSYVAAFGLQITLAGVSLETIWLGMWLAPPTMIGIFVGRLLAARVTEQVFRWALILVLGATTISLFLSSIPNLVIR